MSGADRDPETRRRLEIVPAGGVSMETVSALRRALDRRLGTRSSVGTPLPLYPEWRDGDTGRVRSGALLDALLARPAEGEEDAWVLAVADEELCAPEHPRVFGEAAVGGGRAVVGLGALEGEKPDVSTDFLSRAVKAAVHEIGHAAGLEHCADPGCVMYPSRDIADTDRKGEGFCARCRAAFPRTTLDREPPCD